MISLILLGVTSIASGAAIQQRDAVPSGYAASPYYPGKEA